MLLYKNKITQKNEYIIKSLVYLAHTVGHCLLHSLLHQTWITQQASCKVVNTCCHQQFVLYSKGNPAGTSRVPE